MIRVGEVVQMQQVGQTSHLPVEHWHWVNEMELLAEQMGIETPAICGAMSGVVEWGGDPDDMTPGEAILKAEPTDCPACLRVLENQVLERLMLDSQ